MKTKLLKGLSLLALWLFGMSGAKAETEGFDSFNTGYDSSWQVVLTLPEGWDYEGASSTFSKGTASGEYHKAKPSIGVEEGNTTAYLITPMLQGDFDFFIRNYTSKKQAEITAYACTYSNGQFSLGDELGYKKLTSGNSNWVNVTFNSPVATRVALLISKAYFDDFTYTPSAPQEGPSLVVSGFNNGSEYDFGTVAEGTSKTFVLINQGSEELLIENFSITGGFTLSESAPVSIGAGETSEITVLTPSEDADGELAIYSNDKDSPYVVKLKSVYKVPKPVMAVSPAEINLGKATEDVVGTFSVYNEGDALLIATLTIDNSAFELNKSTLNIEPGQNEEVSVTFHYNVENYGVNTAKITLKPNEGDEAFVNVFAKVSDPNAWSADFSSDELPRGWEADMQGWSFVDGVARGKYVYSSKCYLTTPELIVNAGDEMDFQYKATANNVTVKIQYSRDGGEFRDYKSISGLNKMDNYADFTISGLEPGSYRFRFQNDDYDLDNFGGFQLNANAPKLEVSPLEDASFGKVISAGKSKKYTIMNAGTGLLSVSIASDSEDFSVEPSEITDIMPDNPAEFTVKFNYDIENLGEKHAVITVTPSYNSSAKVVFNANANAKNPDLWEEDFEEGIIPEGWSTTGWTVEKSSTYNGNGTYMAYAGINSNVPVIITPRLLASAGQELKFEIGKGTDEWDPMTVEYSHDQNVWTALDDSPFKSGGTYTFTAPESGYYYLRFCGRYGRIDNFSGFKLALKEHDLSFGGQTVPTQGYQYVDYNVEITLKEMTGKEENVRVALYFGEEEMVAAETVIEPNATDHITLSFTPVEAGDVVASIIVTYADGEILKGETVSVNIQEAPVWDENGKQEFETETIPALIFDYEVADGWNSISVPFALNDQYLTQIFGTGYTVYELKAYEDNTIKFQVADQYNGKYASGYPYIVFVQNSDDNYSLYSDEVINDSPVILKDVRVDQPIPQEDRRGLVGFKGSFAYKDLDENSYEIDNAKGTLNNTQSINAFRACISLDPEIETLPRVKFYDRSGVETGIEQIYEDVAYPEGIFNLNGVRVKEPLAPGIYIINGRLILKK